MFLIFVLVIGVRAAAQLFDVALVLRIVLVEWINMKCNANRLRE